MSASLRETFNDLATLKQACDHWGREIKPHLSDQAITALIDAMEQDGGRRFTYTASDAALSAELQKQGPDRFGWRRAVDLTLKSLKQMDTNISILLPFMKATTAAQAWPQDIDRARLLAIADRHGLETIRNVLSSGPRR